MGGVGLLSAQNKLDGGHGLDGSFPRLLVNWMSCVGWSPRQLPLEVLTIE